MSTFLVFYKKELTTIAFPKVCATRHWFCEMLIGTNLRKIWFKIKKFKMWNLKKGYKWTCLQNRNRLTDIENKLNKLMVTKEDGERDKVGIWD